MSNFNKPKYEFTSTDQNRTQNNYKPLLANNMPIILVLMVSKLGEKDSYLPLRRKKQCRVIFPVIKHLINERFKLGS